MTTVGIYTASVNHYIETIAYWIAARRDIKLLLVTPEHSDGPEHAWCLKRLEQHAAPNIAIVSPQSQPQLTDWLLISLSERAPLKTKTLDRWVASTWQIGLLTHAHDRSGWKSRIKEALYGFPYPLLSKAVVLQTAPAPLHPYRFVQYQAFYSPSVHPQFLVNQEYYRLMFNAACAPEAPRTFKFNFLGNKNPPERAAILRQIRHTVDQIAPCDYLKDYEPDWQFHPDKTYIFWREYGDRDQIRGLQPPLYINVLRQSDFCICPLGWGGNWTHRVVEALVCGAIPILEDQLRYNIGLADAENCIVVRQGDWSSAIARAAAMPLSQRVEIRTRISQLSAQHLMPEVAAAKFRNLIHLR